MATSGDVRIRVGTASDLPRLLVLYDEAVEWLCAQGRAGQWGSKPWSAQPELVERVRCFAASGGLRVAEIDGVAIGAVCVGDAPDFVPPAREPELFVEAFVVDRAYAGRGVGRALLDHARGEAVERGVALLRLDCWAGGDQALVRYYERLGFVPVERFSLPFVLGLDGWEGQVLSLRVGDR